MLNEEQTNALLDTLDANGVKHITLETRASAYLYQLAPCDSDWMTFHKGEISPRICDKLEVCDYQTTDEPVYKDWYMTVNYHS